jgi:hypothetical protein
MFRLCLQLRGRLEQAMSPLASLLTSPARSEQADAREMVGIACVLEEGEEGEARRLVIKGLVEVLERERCVMVRAGRIGALSAKMEPKETIQYVLRWASLPKPRLHFNVRRVCDIQDLGFRLQCLQGLWLSQGPA